jgi:ion channel-forming bestrophin family protein
MAPYDPHRWTSHLFDIEGSMVREILGRVMTCVIWSAVVVGLYQHGPDWFDNLAIAETAHALIGASMGLLLVFRTNASYDRFWEGRKLWGGIVNETRNLARQSSVWLAADGELTHRVIWWTVAFAHSTMSRLRGIVEIGPAQTHLSTADADDVLKNDHVPLAIARRLTELIAGARERRLIDSHQLQSLDQNVQLLIDYCGACERIRSTPLPFAYAVHLRRALIVYCFTLPLALVQKYGWETVPVTLMIAYVLFGIEEIGVEIEDPFGSDVNDLPLEKICETITANLGEITGATPSEASTTR